MTDDIRFALRSLPRQPAFSLVAILTLALGIGANTAAFSVAYGALFKPLPGQPDRRSIIWEEASHYASLRAPRCARKARVSGAGAPSRTPRRGREARHRVVRSPLKAAFDAG